MFDSVICDGSDGGAVYINLNKNAQFYCDEGSTFLNCETKVDGVSGKGGRGGGIYLHLSDDYTNNFTVGMFT